MQLNPFFHSTHKDIYWMVNSVHLKIKLQAYGLYHKNVILI